MSDTTTPPSDVRVDHDVHGAYPGDVEQLRTRLLYIGLFLLAVVILGGVAGLLTIVTDDTNAVVASVSVVAGCVVAVVVALVLAMAVTREVVPSLQQPPTAPPWADVPARETPVPVAGLPHAQAQAPTSPEFWSRPDEAHVLVSDDPDQRREVFVKLALRLQSLINRAIKRIDELERDNEDPELLNGLYEIDHLFTLARRQGENLAVLGGDSPQRRSNDPVRVYAALLAAVSEAEHYRQIAIVPVEEIEIHGHAVAEIIHLLAELLENATRFTSPDGPKVEVRAQKVTAGLAIEVQDRGLGMSYDDLERINRLLDGSTHIDISELLQDGRIGLAVVRELARRHDIRVRLQSNIFGGIAAVVVIPSHLLVEPAAVSAQHRARPQSVPARREPAALATPDQAGSRPYPAPSPTPREVPGHPGDPSDPTTAPGPLPLHAASVAAAASPSFGTGAPRTRQACEEPEPDHGLPSLPVRAPGKSYNDLRSGTVTGISGDIGLEPPTDEPPPLPQRDGSYLREELLDAPAPTTPVPGHNTELMKTVQTGREHWLTEQNREGNTNRGDSTPWPTT